MRIPFAARPQLHLTPRAATPAMSLGSLIADPAADPIATAFSFVTFAPQPVWLLLVLAPNWKVTRAIMEPLGFIVLLSLAHLLIVYIASTQGVPAETARECARPRARAPRLTHRPCSPLAAFDLFNSLFDPQTDGLATYVELASYRNFAAEEWPHVLIWDLWVGRWIWLDGRRRDVFCRHSVLLTNLIGPPGLLCHLLTSLLLGKGLPDERVESE